MAKTNTSKTTSLLVLLGNAKRIPCAGAQKKHKFNLWSGGLGASPRRSRRRVKINLFPKCVNSTTAKFTRNLRSLFLVTFAIVSIGCTIQQTINIQIMSRQKKSTIKFYNKYNTHEHCSQGEVNKDPSVTSQGEAVSMAEMIRRYTRGDIPPLAEAAFHGRDIDMDLYSGSRPPQDLTEVESLAKLEIKRQEELKALKALKTSEPKGSEKEPAKRGDESEGDKSAANKPPEA